MWVGGWVGGLFGAGQGLNNPLHPPGPLSNGLICTLEHVLCATERVFIGRAHDAAFAPPLPHRPHIPLCPGPSGSSTTPASWS